MNNLKRLIKQLTGLMFVFLLAANLVLIAVFVTAWHILGLSPLVSVLICLLVALVSAGGLAVIFARYFTEPIEAVWRATIHVSKGSSDIAPPHLEKVRIGRELVSSLCAQIYDLASNGAGLAGDQAKADIGMLANDILSKFPLPVIALNASRQILYVNEAATAYAGLEEPIGKSYNTVLKLNFVSTDTIDDWLTVASASRVTDVHHWEHSRLRIGEGNRDEDFRSCDIAAYFNKDNPLGYETVLTLFDKTDAYRAEDNGFDYVALAVHELRTPLTTMRGYLEVFEEELEPQLTPELADFMRKLVASAQQLSAFISNILNVARVDEGQFEPKLQKEDWSALLPQICGELELRARLRGKELQYDIAQGLPPVAVDRLSIYEVMANLVENAIKYSPAGDRIIIKTRLNESGMIETTVQDFGIGMEPNILEHLFTKFYRNHRSRAQVTGSGLGLYLVKSIVTAHGGDVWVKSKEGQGSTFGFTLMTYDSLAEDTKQAGEQRAITHQAHGWIKNHTMRRQ